MPATFHTAPGYMTLLALLALHPTIVVEAYVFQSYSGAYGGGVCRGISSGYVAAFLDEQAGQPNALAMYRRKMSNSADPTEAATFLAMQQIFSQQKAAGLITGATLGSVLSQHRAAGTLGGVAPAPPITAAAAFTTAGAVFAIPGVYFVALPGHAVVVVNNGVSWYFMDPNTAEFSSTVAANFTAFMAGYYGAFVAGTPRDGNIIYFVRY